MSLAWISRLPADILWHILPYTYCPQSPTLLRDICHFTRSKEHAIQMYMRTCEYVDAHENHSEWMVNDIFTYFYESTMLGKMDNYDAFFMRAFRINHVTQVDSYVRWLERQRFETQFNLLWGLLTESERNTILCEHLYLQWYLIY